MAGLVLHDDIGKGAAMTQHGHDDLSASSTADQGRGVVAEAKGAAQDVIGEARAAGSSVRQEVSGLGGTIKQGLSDQVEQQKNGIADRIGAIAERAQRTADDLSKDEAWLGNMLGRGARELQTIAGDIRNNDIGSIVGSAEVFARRQPALFMGAAVALGFALTRVIRAAPAGGAGAAHGHDDTSSYGSRSTPSQTYTSGAGQSGSSLGTARSGTMGEAGSSIGTGHSYGGPGQGGSNIGTGQSYGTRESTGPVTGGSNI
jgi:hypothetical protein